MPDYEEYLVEQIELLECLSEQRPLTENEELSLASLYRVLYSYRDTEAEECQHE